MNKEKNKRGDISTLILVIGVFLVCAIMIFSFLFFNTASMQKFEVLGNMAFVNSIAEKIRFYENAELEPADFLDVKKENNMYNIISEKKSDETREFYVEYIIHARAGLSEPVK